MSTDMSQRLTERERQVLRGYRDGLTGKEIAAQIGLQPTSIRQMTMMIRARLGLHDLTLPGVVVAAIRAGEIALTDPVTLPEREGDAT